MTNTPRTWEGDFKKDFRLIEQVAQDEADGTFVLESDREKVLARIKLIEDEAVRREQARIKLFISNWKTKTDEGSEEVDRLYLALDLQRIPAEKDLLNNN